MVRSPGAGAGAGAGSSSAEEYRSRRADWLASGGRGNQRRAQIAGAVLFALAVIGVVVLRVAAGRVGGWSGCFS